MGRQDSTSSSRCSARPTSPPTIAGAARPERPRAAAAADLRRRSIGRSPPDRRRRAPDARCSWSRATRSRPTAPAGICCPRCWRGSAAGRRGRDDPSAGDQDAAEPARRLDPVKALRDLLPKDFRKSLARLLPTRLRDKLAQRVDTAAIDWSRTRAFCLPTDLEGCIRINLKGREPQGIVEPGAEYEALLPRARRPRCRSWSIRPPGGRAVREVLIVPTRPSPARGAISCPTSSCCGTARRRSRRSTSPRDRRGRAARRRTARPGHPQAGPGFVARRRRHAGAGSALPERAHIFDFAPTLLARLGCRAPARTWQAGHGARRWSLSRESASRRDDQDPADRRRASAARHWAQFVSEHSGHRVRRLVEADRRRARPRARPRSGTAARFYGDLDEALAHCRPTRR